MKVYIVLTVLFAVLAGTEAEKLTDDDKTTIVNKHNELRRGVQPTASNMLKMSWSEAAAANAQSWADKSQCLVQHSDRNDRKISTSSCGENIVVGYSYTGSQSWAEKIKEWYDEVKDWKYGEGPVNGATVGHFTQVVWYRSNLIGCAVAHCPNAEYKYIYVCQYCPPGNYQLRRPYKKGEACGDCPDHCDNGLCTNPCPHKDGWSNCPSLKEEYTCNHGKFGPTIRAWCQASCQCTTEIV